ncbi:hypothetical protein Aperf_G00000089956 [Anoplocephala perfoliata]
MAFLRQSRQAAALNLTEDQFNLAVSLLRDAWEPRLELKYQRTPTSVRLYNLYFHRLCTWPYEILLFVNMSMILFEEPATFKLNDKPLHCYIPLAINVVCSDPKWVNMNWALLVTIICLSLLFVDILIFIAQNIMEFGHPYRWMRFLRPVLCFTYPENRRLRKAYENIRNTVIDVLPVIAILLLSIIFTSLLTLKVLDADLMGLEGKPYLSSFGEIVWELYVLTTSANSPDIIIPAYEKNPLYFLIYVWICVVNNWLFLSILTACVYSGYKSYLGEYVVHCLIERKRILDEAFTILQSPTSSGTISKSVLIGLVQRVLPKKSESSIALIYDLLDPMQTGLTKDAFARLTEYMHLHFEEIPLRRDRFERYLPHFYSIFIRKSFQRFVHFVQSRWFHFGILGLIIASVITTIAMHGSPYENITDWIFTGIFAVEIIFRFLASGGVNFFTDGWNIFDAVVVGIALITQIIYEILKWAQFQLLNSSFSQAILALRLLRILKILAHLHTFRSIINSIILIFPYLVSYAGILMIIFYIFTCFGMILFSDTIRTPPNFNYSINNACGNRRLIGSTFEQNHYCDFNFSNAVLGFLTMFIFSVGNNWHIIIDGFNQDKGNIYRIIFATAHFLCIFVVLNVILAFIIDAFLIEYNLKDTRFEDFIRQHLIKLGVDAETELQKLGLVRFQESDFHVTLEQLDAAFPAGTTPTPTKYVYFFKPEHDSLELLTFRMFEGDIETMVNDYHARRSRILRQSTFGSVRL